MKLENSVPSGPDAVSEILSKKCTQVLTLPLDIIFRISLEAGYFLSSWKMANISHQSSRMVTTGITLWTTGQSLFSACLLKFLKLLSKKRFWIECLISFHSYLFGRSVACSLMFFTEYLTSELDTGNQVDVVYLSVYSDVS